MTPWTLVPRLPCPWDSPGKNTTVGCHSLLQGVFPMQGSNLDLLHCRQILYRLSHQGPQSYYILSKISLLLEAGSAIRVVSSAYLKLLIFLLEILIPACASSSLAFYVMYSAYKLNKQGDNIQPWYTPFPIWNQSIVPSPVLAVASWPAYRFLRRQVRWSVFPSLEKFKINGGI